LPQAFDDFDAVDDGHHEIENDQVGNLGEALVERSVSIAARHVEPERPADARDDLEHGWIVVDHQQSRGR
jgi:hypothetical protein